MNFLLVCLLFNLNLDLDKSVTVISGTLHLSDGTVVEVGQGTFIPSPFDMEIARKILWQQSEIDILNERLKYLTDELGLYKEHWAERELDLKNWYEEKYKSVRLENEMLKSWWNDWGETLLWCIGTSAASAFLTYEIMKNG